jgi:hypothetical protein
VEGEGVEAGDADGVNEADLDVTLPAPGDRVLDTGGPNFAEVGEDGDGIGEEAVGTGFVAEDDAAAIAGGLDEAFAFDGFDSGADGGAGDAQGVGQIVLGGEGLAYGEVAIENPLAKLADGAYAGGVILNGFCLRHRG